MDIPNSLLFLYLFLPTDLLLSVNMKSLNNYILSKLNIKLNVYFENYGFTKTMITILGYTKFESIEIWFLFKSLWTILIVIV